MKDTKCFYFFYACNLDFFKYELKYNLFSFFKRAGAPLILEVTHYQFCSGSSGTPTEP